MKFSTKTRYGLRFMVYLAQNSGKDNIKLKNISSSEDISLKYLSQLVITLKNAGLIISKRGSNGGYKLANKPKNINIRQIVELFEGSLYPTDCVMDPSICQRSNRCVTCDVWKSVGDVLIKTLEGITLIDVVKNYNKNNEVLNYSI